MIKVGKVCFLLRKYKISEANKMLFCDCLDKLRYVLLLFQVVTNVRNIILCVIVPKEPNFSVKMKYCGFCRVGQVL